MRSADFGTRSRMECGTGLRVPVFSILHSALRTQTMRVAFFRRLFRTGGPTAEKQRPKRHRAGNDEQPKSPTPMHRVLVNLLHANQNEWDGEDQPASQVSSKRNQKHRKDHSEAVFI